MDVKIQTPEPSVSPTPPGDPGQEAGSSLDLGPEADARFATDEYRRSSGNPLLSGDPLPGEESGDEPNASDTKKRFLTMSLVGHALPSTVGNAERSARSVVERIRSVMSDVRERASTISRRIAKNLRDEPTEALRSRDPEREHAASNPALNLGAEVETNSGIDSDRTSDDLFSGV